MLFKNLQKKINLHHENKAIHELEKKCNSSNLLKNKPIKNIYTCYYPTRKLISIPPILAIAEFDRNLMAVYELKTKKSYDELYSFLHDDTEKDDTIIIFSKQSYDNLNRFNSDCKLVLILDTTQ